MGRLRTVCQVVLRASLPYILTGMRISLALALIVTVVAEMIAGSAGVGYYPMASGPTDAALDPGRGTRVCEGPGRLAAAHPAR